MFKNLKNFMSVGALKKQKNVSGLKNEKGFTLIEFLIVLAAVGVVVALTLAVLKPIFGKSKVSAAVGSINNLKDNAMVYSSDNMNSFTGISLTTMNNMGILGSNWLNACPPAANVTAHCNPWTGAYVLAAGAANPSSTFTISLVNIPESDAYSISSNFWNSDDNLNADTGGTYNVGTVFTPTGGSAEWFSQGPDINGASATLSSSKLGTLEIYFGY